MKQEDKELLLKDLCARLPHGVKMINTEPYDDNHNPILTLTHISEDNAIGCRVGKGFMTTSLGSIKPYLFPLSNMTSKQKSYIHTNPNGVYIQTFDNVVISASTDGFDWLNKNHFDYRGLIEKGLAIDATGLDIY